MCMNANEHEIAAWQCVEVEVGLGGMCKQSLKREFLNFELYFKLKLKTSEASKRSLIKKQCSPY